MNIDLTKSEYDGEGGSLTENTAASFPVKEAREGESFVIDSKFEPRAGQEEPAIAIKKETARSRIAFLYVSSFLGIIVVVFLYAIVNSLKINDIKDLLVTISGIMSGPLGFIIGYYFKSADDNNDHS